MVKEERTDVQGVAIGIDLGTTNSVMMHKGRIVETILNRESEESTPSVVSYYKNQILVGSMALKHAEAAPENTIFSIKRLIGRAFTDKKIQELIEKDLWQYRIIKPSKGTEDNVSVILGDKEYNPIDISALILEKMKEDAEKRFNRDVTHAIITVPAYFSEKQREATCRAGWKAGFKVKNILDEPTAAAIAYGVDNIPAGEVKTVLVYDLGGGTFDVSVLMIAGGTFAQLNIGGDLWLGGDDFDQMIIDYVARQVKEKTGIAMDLKKDKRLAIKLKKEAENVKKQLSSMNHTTLFIPEIFKDPNGLMVDIDEDITKEQFESWIAPHIARSIEIVADTISGAKISKEQIDSVLLVGGSTNIPYVQGAVADFFGQEKVLRNINPMRCVAQGAAILAPKIQQIGCPQCHKENEATESKCIHCGLDFTGLFEKEDPISVSQVTSKPLGIQAKNDKFEVIIEKGTVFPTEPKTATFYPGADNVRRVKVPVYSGFSEVASENIRMGTMWLSLPKGATKETPVDVTFTLNKNGYLTKVIIELTWNGKKFKTEKCISRDDSDAWEGLVDRDISQAEEIIAEKQNEGILNHDTAVRILDKIDAITEEINRGDQRLATDHACELLREANQIQPPPVADELIQKSEGLCGYTEALLNLYGDYLTADKRSQLQQKANSLRDAISRGDRESIERKRQELDAATDDAGLVNFLMMARVAELNIENPAEADRVRVIRSDLEAAVNRGDTSTAERKISELQQAMTSARIGGVGIGAEKPKLVTGNTLLERR